MPVKCTNRSLPPSSGVMKPKPLSSLNHLTVPVAIGVSPCCVVLRTKETESNLRAPALTFAGSSPALQDAKIAARAVLWPPAAHLVDRLEPRLEAHLGRVQVQAPHPRPLCARDPDRVVVARLEALGPLARRLRVVVGERLHVLGHEAGALEREQ